MQRGDPGKRNVLNIKRNVLNILNLSPHYVNLCLKIFLGPAPPLYCPEKLFGFWKIFFEGAPKWEGAQIFYFTPQPKTTWHGPDCETNKLLTKLFALQLVANFSCDILIG